MTTYTHTDSDGDKLEVISLARVSAVVTAENARNGHRVSVSVDADAAPAVALAILEKSGADAAAAGLRALIEETEKAKAKAEDEAKLLAEARAIYEYADPSWASHRPWADDAPGVNTWLRAAMKARELHQQTKEA